MKELICANYSCPYSCLKSIFYPIINQNMYLFICLIHIMSENSESYQVNLILKYYQFRVVVLCFLLLFRCTYSLYDCLLLILSFKFASLESSFLPYVLLLLFHNICNILLCLLKCTISLVVYGLSALLDYKLPESGHHVCHVHHFSLSF